MNRKYTIALIALLISCAIPSSLFSVQGDGGGASYVFSDEGRRFVDCSSLKYTLFVSPEGSDANPGTEDLPYRTISRAALKAQAGDNVLVRQGSYKESVEFVNSGAEEHPILFVAEDGVVVEGPDDMSSWEGVFMLHSRRHITLSGFHLNNSDWFGIMVDDCSHIIVDSCFVENTEASGIMAWDSDHVLIINNRVRNVCAYDGDPPGLGSQECISVSDSDTFQVLYNEVYESSSGYGGGEGINTKQACSHGEVAYNLLHDNIKVGIYVDSYEAELSDVSVHSNIVYSNGQGIAVSSEEGGITRNVRVYNNLVVDSVDSGIIVGDWDMNGLRENVSIVCNTVLRNGYPDGGGGISIQDLANITDLTIRNNLVSDSKNWQIEAWLYDERG